MKKHKRTFEDYEEIALDLRTAREILIWSTHIFLRASYSDKIINICRKIDRLISEVENEMYKDYPDRANTSVFYGGDRYRLDIRKHRSYIYSSFGKEVCKHVDAFAVLTKQGIVLLSDDAQIMPFEDSQLYNINQKMLERKREQKNENSNARQKANN